MNFSAKSSVRKIALNATSKAKAFFSYKTSFILLVILASFASSFTMMFKNQKWMDEQRQAEARSQSVQKMNPFKRIVHSKISELRSELVSFAIARKTQNSNLNFANFRSVALMRPAPKGFAAKWRESAVKQSSAESEEDLALLNQLPFEKIEQQGFAWFKFQDSHHQAIFAVLLEIEGHQAAQNKKAFLVGLSTQNPLASVAEDYIGTSGRIYLLNDSAFVASHTEKNYIGDLFTEDPIYKDIARSGRSQQARLFTDLSGRSVYAYYEKVEQSNLYAVVSAPRLAALDLSAQRWQAGFPTILALVGLFGVMALFFAKILPHEESETRLPEQSLAPEALQPTLPFTSPNFSMLAQLDFNEEDEFEDLERNLKTDLMKKGLASLNPFSVEKMLVVPAPEVKLSLVPSITAEVSNRLLKDISSGMNRIFMERTSGILAQANLILAKSNDEEIKSHAKSIEKESRKSRELLKELEQFSSEKASQTQAIDLGEVCRAAVQSLNYELDQEEIKVHLELEDQILVLAQIEKLQMAIENILKNSIEALRGRQEKSVTIKAFVFKNLAELVISDNGIGMSKETQEKIFRPFFRAFENADSNGLGLAYVDGVVASISGEISVDSTPGFGTEMKIKLPVQKSTEVTPHSIKVIPDTNLHHYDALKNPALKLDFEEESTPLGVFELDEDDVDQVFNAKLEKLTTELAQKNAEGASEFNIARGFDEDDEADDFKVLIREPRSKTLS